MKVVLSVLGTDFEAQLDPRFGRCEWFAIVDSDSLELEARMNSANASAQGAGIAAAQLVLDLQADVLITGHVGPNAFQVLNAAGLKIYNGTGLNVRQALDQLKQGKLAEILAAGPSHAGIGKQGNRNQHGRR